MRDSSSPESGVRNSATRLSRTVQRHTPAISATVERLPHLANEQHTHILKGSLGSQVGMLDIGCMLLYAAILY
jgi:hypothetical protein